MHYILTRNAIPGNQYTLYVELAINSRNGNTPSPDPDVPVGETSLTLQACDIRVCDRELWTLMFDYVVMKDMALQLASRNHPRGQQALQITNQMIDTIRWEDRATFAAARALCAPFLAQVNADTQHRVFAT